MDLSREHVQSGHALLHPHHHPPHRLHLHRNFRLHRQDPPGASGGRATPHGRPYATSSTDPRVRAGCESMRGMKTIVRRRRAVITLMITPSPLQPAPLPKITTPPPLPAPPPASTPPPTSAPYHHQNTTSNLSSLPSPKPQKKKTTTTLTPQRSTK